jgi:hypothetical protein
MLVAGGTALGLAGTVATHSVPGALLGLCLVGGTALAALAVRPGAVYLLIPVPPLAYLVAATVAGVLGGNAPGTSRSALAVSGAQWLASGFLAMATASALAAALAIIRGLRWRCRR